jgi:ATP-dependent DNA helicase RecG
MAFAAENGLQSALMAPTEILAGQHARSLENLLAGRGYRVARLVSGMRTGERREALRALASGEAQIAVGTHALLEKDVRFRRLGLVIVDEQHRFGVLQRARLAAKSHGGAPDILLMTATPIPRTLSMTLYGDLDTSLLDEMPPGRTPVDTLVKSEADRPWLYEWLSEEIARGEQAFVVYPLVEEREDLELKAAAAMARKLGAAVMRRGPTGPEPCRVGLVHGRMKGREKTDVLDAFRAGALDILVATTVIEVGIDVPSVRALVIEHADRFGLSQLHQLRGRIGRGAGGGTCVLMTGDSPTPAAQVRLAAIGRERSGFRLAEIDFGLRGPGEMLGTRQTGMPALRIAVLARDGALLDLARREAFAMIERPENEKLPQVRALLERVPRPWRERIGLSRIG